jgi:hypothetical protein
VITSIALCTLQVEGKEALWLVGNRLKGKFVTNVKHNFIFYASLKLYCNNCSYVREQLSRIIPKGKGKNMKNLLSACLVQKQECEFRFQAAIMA